MTNRGVPRLVTVGVVLVAAAIVMFGFTGRTRGIEPGLYEVSGNPSCATLNADSFFDNITSDFGFKIEGNGAAVYTGTFYLTSAYGILTGGAPEDPTNSVTLNSADGVSFGWLASLGIDAVIVKGGPDSNVYVYVPEAYAGNLLTTPDGQQISHVEYCYDYELAATKTANATYTRTYTWELSKAVDPASHSGFAGDTFSSDYDVVVDRTVTDSAWAVSGNIVIGNPTPYTVDFSVSDSVGGTNATVDCPSSSVAPGGSVTCTYTAALTSAVDGTNTATVTSLTAGVNGTTATAGYAFGDPTTVVGYPTINVTDSVQGALGSASGDYTFEYSDDFACSSNPADYTNGFYTTDYPNTATIDETEQSDSEQVTVDCYAPVVSKDADTEWFRQYDWTISKAADPTSHSGFVGETFTSNYDVIVDQTISEYGYRAFGTISVSNPTGAPASITVDVADAVNGTTATVDCDGAGATSLTVAAGATETCDYTVNLTDTTSLTNTATVTFNTIDFPATAAVVFGDPTVVGYPTINVTDSVQGALGSASGDYTFEYSDDFACSSNPADYTNGFYTTDYPNTATIDETEQSDSEQVTVDCYAPVVSKTAAGTYDETHTWTVAKSVTPTSQSGFPGDNLPWTWTVDVTESSADSNFAVTGTITVVNPSPDEEMVVDLADILNDGTLVTITECTGGTLGDEMSLMMVTPVGETLTIPADTTAVCDYEATPDDASATLNTATATLNEVDFTGTASVSFTANVIDGTATLSDDEIGLSETLTAGTGPWQFTGDDSHTCSTEAAAYGTTGSYGATVDNTATLLTSITQTDDASTTYTCQAGFLDVLKLTNGNIDMATGWQFALYLGPDGFGGTQVGSTSSTAGDPDGILDFGGPALRPDTTYTVCELGISAGWTSFWQVDVNGDGVLDAIVIPYDPNANDVPPEDLGNRCVEVGAGTNIPLTVGTTVHFQVDNSYPGGDPRTPGYWKNWNRCTNGGQQYTADANGGWAAGFWLLEDVLDPSIGGGIVWDDILSDSFVFDIDTCDLGVSILNAKDFATGKNMNSDPIYTLAKHLFAAQLNFGAGACTPAGDVYNGMTINEVAAAAETLLDKYDFDAVGPGGIAKKDKVDGPLALTLANILDQYNNGNFCGSDMP